MNTCSLFMSNASRHQLDRPLYLPVGTRERGRHDRITYYVFIFFSSRARPVIKGAPAKDPDDLPAMPRRSDKMGPVDNEGSFRCVSTAGSSTSGISCPCNNIAQLLTTAPIEFIASRMMLRASRAGILHGQHSGHVSGSERRHYARPSGGINKIISHVYKQFLLARRWNFHYS